MVSVTFTSKDNLEKIKQKTSITKHTFSSPFSFSSKKEWNI